MNIYFSIDINNDFDGLYALTIYTENEKCSDGQIEVCGDITEAPNDEWKNVEKMREALGTEDVFCEDYIVSIKESDISKAKAMAASFGWTEEPYDCDTMNWG